MPKATTQIKYRPLSEKDQKDKDAAKIFEIGDEVPKDIADQIPGSVDAPYADVRSGDVTSDAAVQSSIINAPDHPDRPKNIPGVDEWKVAKGAAVSKPEETAAKRAEFRRDVEPSKAARPDAPAAPKK